MLAPAIEIQTAADQREQARDIVRAHVHHELFSKRQEESDHEVLEGGV